MHSAPTNIENLIKELFEKLSGYLDEKSVKKIQTALEFTSQAHKGQIRKSGEFYIIHPIRTVVILTKLHVDEETIIASLLHDVPEDTEIKVSEIESKFGKRVAYLVDGVTKLSKVHYREQMERRHVESLKKLFIHSAKDLRVILIKLADRLDNMRTLRFIAEEKKRNRIARETSEIYVPIANLLGIGEIRAELEDLCFEYLHPADFAHLKQKVDFIMEERNFVLEEMIHLTEKELTNNKIEAELVGRRKTLSSIYKKIQTKGSLENIDDIIAIRLIVPTRKDCYEAMGIIHRLFKPKNGSIKDYIAVPKPNGYQSLHTTVFGLSSTIVEYQIRTTYMHLEAEFGIAAHYFYKYTDEKELASVMRKRSSWVQRILEIQKDQTDPEYFMENLKLDIFQDRIFLFSPKGDVVDLPRGASALDFAYSIHSDIGNHATKAEINGFIYPITYTLATGDTIKIITDKNVQPEREWLNYVKTAIAISRIKQFLQQEPEEKKLADGKKYLQKEFDKLGKNYVDELSAKNLKIITKKTPYATLNDLLVAIAEGNVHPKNIMEILNETKEMEAHGNYFFRRSKKEKNISMSQIELIIIGNNKKNCFREILRNLNALNIQIVKFSIDKPWMRNKDRCKLSILVGNHKELAQTFESIEQIDGVEKISRQFFKRQLKFALLSLITAMVWISHPFLIGVLLASANHAQILSEVIIYSGLAMLFGLAFYLNKTTTRGFPEIAETKYQWFIIYMLTSFAFFTMIAERISFNMAVDWTIILILFVAVYAFLTANYLRFRKCG